MKLCNMSINDQFLFVGTIFPIVTVQEPFSMDSTLALTSHPENVTKFGHRNCQGVLKHNFACCNSGR